jgi:hypothetical protein
LLVLEHVTRNPQAVLPIASRPLPPPYTAHIPSPEGETSVAGIVSALGLNDEEWFDAHDVEGYLRGLGIFMEGHTSFVEFPVPASP